MAAITASAKVTRTKELTSLVFRAIRLRAEEVITWTGGSKTVDDRSPLLNQLRVWSHPVSGVAIENFYTLRNIGPEQYALGYGSRNDSLDFLSCYEISASQPIRAHLRNQRPMSASNVFHPGYLSILRNNSSIAVFPLVEAGPEQYQS